MKLIKIATISLALLTISFNTSIAQEKWSLQKCINHAMQSNLGLKQARNAIADTEVGLKQAKQSRLPSLNASTGINFNFGRSIDPSTNAFITRTFIANTLSVSAGMTLYNGGQLNNAVKQGKLSTQAAKMDEAQAQRDIALDVATRYLNVLFAKENLANSQKQLDLIVQQLVQLDKFIEAGSRAANERLDLEAQEATAEQTLIQSENTLEQALLSLKQALRIDPWLDFDVEDPPTNITIETDPDVETFQSLYGEAAKTTPFIKAGELRYRGALVGEKVAKGGLAPRVSIGASLGTNFSNQGRRFIDQGIGIETSPVFINGEAATLGIAQPQFIVEDNPFFNQYDENLGYGFGVNVSIPIYNNHNVRGNIERAKLNILNTEIQNEQQKESLQNTVQQALSNARLAKKQLEASEKAVNAQKAAYENTSKRFDLGAANTFEFVTARNQLESAEINFIIAKYDYLFKLKVLDFYKGRDIKL